MACSRSEAARERRTASADASHVGGLGRAEKHGPLDQLVEDKDDSMMIYREKMITCDHV